MQVKKKNEIIVVVLALLIETICKQVNDSSFISVLSDAFKRKSVKSMTIIEFLPIHELKLKVLEVLSNEGKSSHRNVKATRNLVYKSSTLINEEQLLISFYSGNTHRNFEESCIKVKAMFLLNYRTYESEIDSCTQII